MRNLFLCAASASVLVLSMPSMADTYTFSSGNLPGTVPNPLLSADILELTTGSTKNWNVNWTNQGTVAWQAGNLTIASGATVTNQGLWDASGNNTVSGSGTFINEGTFRKSAGTVATMVSSLFFNNGGAIIADTGTININSGGNTTFNAGSSFSGAGAVTISNNATFNGNFTASNLNFTAGTFTGGNAVLNGAVRFNAGTLAGTWEVANGSTLTVQGGSTKNFNTDNFANKGTVAWQSSNLTIGTGATVTNQGLWDASGDNTISGSGTFINEGTFLKSAGIGATTINNVFSNNGGAITANTGTINFNGGNTTFNAGSSFSGAGAVDISNNATFNGNFTASNLKLTSGTFTGGNAVLNGAARFDAGNLAGTWEVANSSTLTMQGGSTKNFKTDNFANKGTVAWQNGNLTVASGNTVTNQGLWDASSNNTVSGSGTFINEGTFLKSTGIGATTINNVFSNNGGAITANTGTINFNGGNTTFNAGSSFSGAGAVDISNNATFNGNFTASNLRLTSGTFTGGNAILNGAARFDAGNLAGTWEVANSSTLTMQGGSTKNFKTDNFANKGTVAWQNGNLTIASGNTVTNQGLWDASSNNTISGPGTFINEGTFLKSAGIGATTISNNTVINQGTMNVLSGTIALPSNFINNGILAGTGTYSVSGTLFNSGVVAPGDVGETGVLNLSGNYVQTDSGSFAAQLASSLLYDRFSINGFATLDGMLELSCVLGCNISNGDSFVLLTSTRALSGTFSGVTTNGFLDGFSYDLIYDYNKRQVLLSILDIGSEISTPPSGGSEVPEPAGWILMTTGFFLMGFARYNRKRRISIH